MTKFGKMVVVLAVSVLGMVGLAGVASAATVTYESQFTVFVFPLRPGQEQTMSIYCAMGDEATGELTTTNAPAGVELSVAELQNSGDNALFIEATNDTGSYAFASGSVVCAHEEPAL